MIPVLEKLGYHPRLCVWELTLACNLRCLHCGSRAGKARPDELSTEECLRVAAELGELGCERLTLGGGEPLLRPDWPQIAYALCRTGVRANVISNGLSFAGDDVGRGLDAGLTNFAFSLDGLEASHDQVRGRPGSFASARRALDLCVDGGMPTTVVTHLNRVNLGELEELRQLLAGHGVSSWQVQVGNPMGNMMEHDELLIPPAGLLELVPRLAALRALAGAPHLLIADNIGYYGRFERALRDRGARICFWIGCRAGCQVVGIESNGNVKGCLSLPSSRNAVDAFVEDNLRRRSLREIWERPGAFAYNRAFSEDQLTGFCRQCRYRDLCRGGCVWTAFAHTGTRYDNPYCFYRQAVEHGRLDLLPDEEKVGMAAAAAGGPCLATAPPGSAVPAVDAPTCLPG